MTYRQRKVILRRLFPTKREQRRKNRQHRSLQAELDLQINKVKEMSAVAEATGKAIAEIVELIASQRRRRTR